MDGHDLTLVTIVAGLALLMALAWLIGRVDADARNGAWRRIAASRRELHEKEQHLLTCLSGDRCAGCPVDRLFRE
jgi:hypothetical protein